jgi:L,D-transpeptidase ErfK/SrfK
MRSLHAWGLIAALVPGTAGAFSYVLPETGDSVVGALRYVETVREDTLVEMARVNNQGYGEIKWANPQVDPWQPGDGTQLVIPARYILPDAPRDGIVVNIPEMRLYFYPRVKRGEPRVVITHPVGVGREDWKTPRTVTKIVAKKVNPTWYPPASIRAEHAADGDPLAKVIPPGPDNPLGDYAMKLGLSGYLIHGTNKKFGMGMRVTHGCIRMNPEDIERMFPQVAVGTPVHIINQPIKLGILGEELYVEAEPELEETRDRRNDEYRALIDRIVALVGKRRTSINWNAVQTAMTERRGIPVSIGRVEPLAPAPPRHAAQR